MQERPPDVVLVRPGLLGVEVVQMFFYTNDLNPRDLAEKLALGSRIQLDDAFPGQFVYQWERGCFHAYQEGR